MLKELISLFFCNIIPFIGRFELYCTTGNGGAHFEANIQATFVTLMLSGGYAPCLPLWPIVEIKSDIFSHCR
jgi:hypothetical protein